MAEVNKIRLYNHDKPVNGHESLQVSEGSDAEAYWRELGYRPADDAGAMEATAPAEEPDGGYEWPLQQDPADYIEAKTDDDGEPLPDLSDAVRERLALARRIVGADEE